MSPKKFFYVLCGIAAVVVLGGGAGYYLASQALKAETANLSRRLADEQAGEQQLSSLDDLQKQYERLTPLLPVVNSALPNEKNQSTLALQLRNIAEQSGMNLTGLTFSASTQPGPTSQTIPDGAVLAIPVSFKLAGTYDQLQQFLGLQEHLDRYTSVTSLTISSDNTSSKLSFDIALNAFLKP